jgi:hypothetical protein
VPTEWRHTLDRLIEQVRVATGLGLEASIRWVSPEEQRAADTEFDRLLADADVQVVQLASMKTDDPSLSARSYEGYWALVLPGQETSINDDDDFSGVIEEYVIEEVWGRTGSAPNPGFLRA